MCDRNLRSDRKPWGPPRDRKVQGNMNVCGGHDTTLEGTGARAEKGTRPPPTPPLPPPPAALGMSWEGLLTEGILCGRSGKGRGMWRRGSLKSPLPPLPHVHEAWTAAGVGR